MEALLSIIGLICILWLCSKALKTIGTVLEALGTAMENKKRSVEFIRHDQEKIIENLKKMNKKIDTIKDSQYKDRVRQEIDELTK